MLSERNLVKASENANLIVFFRGLRYLCAMKDYTIILAQATDRTHYEAVVRLLKQLTTRSITFTEADYNHLVLTPNSHLLLLQCDNTVVGMVTIGIYPAPTGNKAWIEDVVIDVEYRGCGLGRKLLTHAIESARLWGADSIMLTSNPSRIIANELYRSLCFEQKETNVYKMNLC